MPTITTKDKSSPQKPFVDVRRNTLLFGSIMLAILIGFWLRLFHLGGDSLWYDELLTLNIARNGFPAAFSVRSHPPLYYLLTTLSTRLLGEQEFSLRLLPALAGSLALPSMAVLSRSLDRPRAGLWAWLLLALSPFHLQYSQEGRHYSLLMTLSLLSTILLIRAMKKPNLNRWCLYGLATIANLYTHYGALLALLSQAPAIILWMLQSRNQKSHRWPFVSALLVVVLFSPQIPHLLGALNHNIGTSAMRGATNIAQLATWLNQAFLAFGYSDGVLPYLTAAFGLFGLLALIHKREWNTLTLLAGGMLIPFGTIALVQVARWAFPKYVIYTLPLYLILVSIGLDTGLKWISSRFPRWRPWTGRLLAFSLAFGLVLVLGPRFYQEYGRMERDWRGMVDRIEELGQKDDVIVSLAMDMPNGFNQGGAVLPYYLGQSPIQYSFLASGSFKIDRLKTLSAQERDVWGVMLNRRSMENIDFPIETFQGEIHLVHLTLDGATTDEKLEYLLDRVLPLALAPSPQCLLQRDMVAVQVANNDYSSAAQTLVSAEELCPGLYSGNKDERLIRSQIYQNLLAQAMQSGDTDQSNQIAHRLLQWDAKDPIAWNALTATDLYHQFEQGDVLVSDDLAPTPVSVDRFVMPQDGDWGHVLLIHPPSSVAFPLNLPDKPVDLVFRIAMAPASWEWGGDGATFIVTIQSSDPAPVELFRYHVSNDPADRHWHNALIPLSEYAGKMVTLTLATEAGAAHDTTGDWAGWETPRIIWHND